MVLRLTMVSLNLLGREDLDGVALRALVAFSARTKSARLSRILLATARGHPLASMVWHGSWHPPTSSR
jgi:hypothetical protein